MASIMIADIRVNDPDSYDNYKKGVAPLIAKHGGEYLVRGGQCETLEGDWTPGRLVVVRFPTRDGVEAFFDDPAYQDLKRLRQRTADSRIVVVDGV